MRGSSKRNRIVWATALVLAAAPPAWAASRQTAPIGVTKSVDRPVADVTPAAEVAGVEARYRSHMARIERMRELAKQRGDERVLARIDHLQQRAIESRAKKLTAVRKRLGDDAFIGALADVERAERAKRARKSKGKGGGKGSRGGAGAESAGDLPDTGTTPPVRDPAPDGKVALCHISPGNPDQRRTIRVGREAMEAHLAHGDFLGPCDGDTMEAGSAGKRRGKPDADERGRGRKGKGGGKGTNGDEEASESEQVGEDAKQRRTRERERAGDGRGKGQGKGQGGNGKGKGKGRGKGGRPE